MKKHHEVSGLHFEGEFMILTIDGQVKKVKVREISPALWRASEQEKTTFEISPSGYGIHWPLLDEDLSIDGLLGIATAPKIKAHGLRKR
jgi:hypothetical protein